jgi:hypothetical protein
MEFGGRRFCLGAFPRHSKSLPGLPDRYMAKINACFATCHILFGNCLLREPITRRTAVYQPVHAVFDATVQHEAGNLSLEFVNLSLSTRDSCSYR